MPDPSLIKSSVGFWSLPVWGVIGFFSGLVGSISGLAGILISYRTFKYNKPSICIEIIDLNYSKLFKEVAEAIERVAKTENKILDPFYNYNKDYSVLNFNLFLNIYNTSGGRGAIRGPQLIIRDFYGKDICSIDPSLGGNYS